MRINRNENRLNLRITSWFFFIFLMLFCSGEVLALNAYVYYHDKSAPDYLTRFAILYAKMERPVGGIYASLPRQYKYLGYDFSKVSKVEFLELIGEEHSCPVFLIRLHLRRRGGARKAWFFPVKELQGWKQGAPWKLPMDSFRGNMENAYKIKEIRFVEPRWRK